MTARTFFVALDFGTYASGFAYAALTGDVVLNWEYPGAPTPYPKTITALLYERTQSGVFGLPKAWGWDARVKYMKMSAAERDQHEYLENFKLSLAPTNCEYLESFQPRSDLPGDKLIADYLRELANLAKDAMAKR